MASSQGLLGGEIIYDKKFEYEEEDPEYKGNELNPELEKGPLEYRKFRDIFWAILYLSFWGLLIFVAVFAFVHGDPSRLATPYDPNGRQCGYKNEKGDARNFPYLYYRDPETLDGYKHYMCIDKCPEESGQKVNCLQVMDENTQKLLPCPDISYKTSQIVKVCNPVSQETSDKISKYLEIGRVNEWASDIKNTALIMIAVAFITLFISFFTVVLIRYCAGCLVWTIIFTYFTLVFTLGSLLIYEAYSGMEDLPSSLQDKDIVVAMGSTLLCLGLISLIIFFCCFKKIKVAIAVLKASADFVRETAQIFLLPVILFFKAFAFFAFWITVCTHIYSSGHISPDPKPFQPFGQIDWMPGVKRSFTVYIIALYWVMEWIMTQGQFILASVSGMWYFSHLPKYTLHHPLRRSFKRSYLQSFGSICFGSLILAIVKLIVLALETLHRNLKNQQQKDITQVTGCALCCVKCAKCCVKCFEKFLRYISSKAFIMMALEGKSFCGSAHDAFYLIFRNKALMAVVSSIGEIFVYFSMLFICITSTFIGYMLITQIESVAVMIYEPAIPTLFFFLISYTISYVFMQVYGMSSDSLLMCLLVDREISKGLPKSIPTVLKMFADEYM